MDYSDLLTYYTVSLYKITTYLEEVVDVTCTFPSISKPPHSSHVPAISRTFHNFFSAGSKKLSRLLGTYSPDAGSFMIEYERE